tara:strand:- start:11728 stop:12330 length:603 start_codon:yes stop_codon:yes gene_type:complete
MNFSKKLFISISITPFLTILLLSLLNISKPHKIKILIWDSPSLSIGYLTAVSSTLGFLYGFITISTISNRSLDFKKTIKVTQSDYYNNNFDRANYSSIDNQDQNTDKNEVYPAEEELSSFYSNEQFIERDLREPTPTITVPYKVIKNISKRSKEIDYETLNDNNISESQSDSSPRYYSSRNSSYEANEGDWGEKENLEEW